MINMWVKLANLNVRGINQLGKREIIENWALNKGIKISVLNRNTIRTFIERGRESERDAGRKLEGQ